MRSLSFRELLWFRTTLAAILLVSHLPRVHAQLYTPPVDGLVGWWRGEGNGSDSADGHDGATLDGVAFGAGLFGEAFRFEATRNRVFVPDSPDFTLTQSLTIAAWVRPRSEGFTILQRGVEQPGTNPYSLSYNAGRYFVFSINGPSGLYSFVSTPNYLQFDQWEQVTATFDAASGDMRLYVNGVLVGDNVTTDRPIGALDPTQNPGITIGNSVSGTLPFVGSIDEVLLYSRALSPAEVSMLVPEVRSLTLWTLAGVIGLTVWARRVKSRHL